MSLQYGTGRWYTQHTTDTVRRKLSSCMVWQGYDVTLGDNYKQSVTETLVDGSVSEFCFNVSQVISGNYVYSFHTETSQKSPKQSKTDGALKNKYPLFPIKLRFYVLDTDYDSYASLYLCYRLFNKIKFEHGWVLTRVPEASDSVIRKGLDAFKGTNITESRLTKMDQGSDCTYDVGERSCRNDDFPDGFLAEGFHVLRNVKRFFGRRARQFLPFLP